IRRVDAVDEIEQGRFPGAVGADQADDLALVHREAHVLDGAQAAEALLQARDLEQSRHSSHPRVRLKRLWMKPSSPRGTNSTMISSNAPAMTSWKCEKASAVSSRPRSSSYRNAPSAGPRIVPWPPSITMTIASIEVCRLNAPPGSMMPLLKK